MDQDEPYDLTCTVDPIKPERSVYWKLGEKVQEQTVTDSDENDDGTYRLEGLLSGADFSGMTSPVQVDCLVTEKNNPETVRFTKQYKSVQIWCKFTIHLLPCNIVSHQRRLQNKILFVNIYGCF